MTNIAICEHIKDNGDTCGSPALTGYSFCYFHQRLRLPRHRPGDFEYKLPILDTRESILMATQHITQAALDGILEPCRARFVLSALRLAKSTLKEIKKDDGQKLTLEEKEQTNVDTGALARVPRAQLAVSAAATDKSAQPMTTIPALSSRAPLLGEGSAFGSVTTAADPGRQRRQKVAQGASLGSASPPPPKPRQGRQTKSPHSPPRTSSS